MEIWYIKKIILNPNFSNLLKRIVNRFKRAGYSLDIMRQTACLVFNPIMVEGYAALFSMVYQMGQKQRYRSNAIFLPFER